MSKLRNHTLGASVTALTLAAVVLTGCGTPDECDDADSMAPMSMVDGRGGTSGGGGGKSSGGGSRSGGKVSVNKPGSGSKQKPSTGKVGGSKTGKTVKVDTDDCEDDD